MAGKSLKIIPFKQEDHDIFIYLEVVKPVLDIVFKDDDASKIHTGGMKLGRHMSLFSGYVRDTPQLTWAQFERYTKGAINPSLGKIIANQQFLSVKFTGNLDHTISQLNQLVVTAFPTDTAITRKESVFNALLRIVPTSVRDNFAITEPKGYDEDLLIIWRILALKKSGKLQDRRN